jgi:L-fuconolactonase
MIIDAHQHFWNYDARKHSWINDSMQSIQRNFTPADLQIVFEKNNIDGCVTVQVEQTEEETIHLIESAKQNSFIKGIVGWTDIQSPDITERLDFFKQFSIVKGFRHVVQAEHDEFLYDQNFRKGISSLQQYNFTYDILVYPRQLKAATDFAGAFPNQLFVLDHLAKPYIKDGLIDEWKKDINALASPDNIWCKLSGLVTEAGWHHHPYNHFIPYLEVAVEAFGINRIMFGSDWPVCLVADSYENVLSIVSEFFRSFTKEEREKFFALNAIEFYNLNIN